ncbi:exonuclease domain-containing protein [Shigella flexneri]
MNQIGAHYEGHKIIEIGAVEAVNVVTGNNFHVYLKPDWPADLGSVRRSRDCRWFSLDKPTFAYVADGFLHCDIRGAELVIHNASFDIGFMDYEFSKLHRDTSEDEYVLQGQRIAWRWQGRCSPGKRRTALSALRSL